jgi:hypothetical protein
MGVKKDVSREGEKISFSEGGGGINIVFGPKYRPLTGKDGSLKWSLQFCIKSWP